MNASIVNVIGEQTNALFHWRMCNMHPLEFFARACQVLCCAKSDGALLNTLVLSLK